METDATLPTICSSCGALLSGSSGCLICLLRGGLEETAGQTPPSSARSTLYGDFEIVRREDGSLWELGRGAMGVTYRAVDRVLHRSVALKVIEVAGKDIGSQAVRERFLREARAAAALRHANVAGVFQFGAFDDEGRCYYAMELVEGETLEARVRREGPLNVDAALGIMSQVAAALTAAAERGLIHRDLKPGNLMLTKSSGPTGTLEVKVIDFGLAKAAKTTGGETDLTQGGFVGTPAFASPEQFEHSNVDARSDIYSLGVTLWYALSGQTPFTGRTMDELRDHPARADLPLAQLTARKVPDPVLALLRSMLAEDPARRPASARELMDALETCREKSGYGRLGRGSLAREPERMSIALRAAVLLAIATLMTGLAWLVVSWEGRDLQLPPTPRGTDKSIAVLPFENLSADKENAFFTDGVQEEILTDLAKIADLKVISRTSVMPYNSGAPRNLREITRELGVTHLLEGSVQRTGNRVRVTAKLIDARNDKHQWAEHYDRDLSDVFAIQSEIAQAIAVELRAKLSPGEQNAIDTPPTTNLAAYDAYLQGRKLARDAELTQEDVDIREAVRRLEEATNRDPRFFLAWCELSRANLNLYRLNLDHTPERLAWAETATMKARRLRPADGEAHLTGGLLLYWGHRDFSGALLEFQAAARLLPNNSEPLLWLGAVLRRQGHWEESIRQIKSATVVDPRNPVLWIILAETEEMVYSYAVAEQAIDRTLTLDPQNLQYALLKADHARMKAADVEPMRRWVHSVSADSEQWRDMAALMATDVAMADRDYPAAARAFSRYGPHPITDRGYILPRSEWEGRIAAASGDKAAAETAFLAARESAEEIFKGRPQDAKALIVLANIDAELGRKNDAIREGKQACAMLPVSEDAFDAPYLIRTLASIYAATGEQDQAIDTLRTIIGKPAGPNYGELCLDHEWDTLRGDPRFESLVATLAPNPLH